jgi:hypothetical protein
MAVLKVRTAMGDDARIEARDLMLDARVSSFERRISIRASTTTTVKSQSLTTPVLWLLPPIFYTLRGEELLSFMKKESFFQFSPVDIFKESLDIISPLQTVIDHERMLKDIHDENRHAS